MDTLKYIFRQLVIMLFLFLFSLSLGISVQAQPLRTLTELNNKIENEAAIVYNQGAPVSGPDADSLDLYLLAISECEAEATVTDVYTGSSTWDAYCSVLNTWWNINTRIGIKNRKVTYFDVNLQGVTTSQYDNAWLEWKILYYKQWQLQQSHNLDYSQNLPLNKVTEIGTGILVPDWVPHSELGSAVSGEAEYITPVPKVYGVVQNYEIYPEPNDPHPELAKTIDPVNTINGAVTIAEIDLLIPCQGIPLYFARTYNSTLEYNGSIGHRWRHSLDWGLEDRDTVYKGETNNWKILNTGNGRQLSFKANGSAFDSPFDNNWEMDSLGANGYRVLIPPGEYYYFTTNGVLIKISDNWSNILTLSYTNSLHPELLTDASHNNGQSLHFSYNSNLLSQVEYSTDFFLELSYNDYGELTNTVRKAGVETSSISYLYDSNTNNLNHSLIQRMNTEGHIGFYSYVTNESGHITSFGSGVSIQTNLYEHTISYTNGSSTVTYKRGQQDLKYEYSFDPVLKRIIHIKSPSSSETNWGAGGIGVEFYRDDFGEATNTVYYDNSLSEALTTISKFDSRHNVTNEATGYCSQPSNTWAYTWHPDYQTLTTITDPEGHKTGFEYTNALPSKIKQYYNDSESYDTVFTYTTNGLLFSVTNANGHWAESYYDNLGFPTSTVPEIGPIVNYAYSPLGHVTNIIMPKDGGGTRITSMDVNELGWINNITYPDNTTESFSFDALGNLTDHVDVAGRTNTYTYLPTRKLSSATRILTGATNQEIIISFDYDQQFNSLKIKDAEDRIVEAYILDLQDRPTTVTNVEGQAMNIVYSLGELVKSVSRFDGTGVTNEYDSSGRLHKLNYSDATNTFTYLKNGLLETATNEVGTVSNEYNFANRLISSSGVTVSGTVEYVYYPVGQVSNVTSVAGTSTYSFDAAERLQTQVTPDGIFSNTYNPYNGLLSSMLCTNTGTSANYEFDVMDRVTDITWKDASNNVLRSFAYSYNSAGMITDVEREDGTEVEYSYDSLDRLTAEKKLNSGGETTYEAGYSFDKVGNRTQKTVNGFTVSYTVATNGNCLNSWTVTPPVTGAVAPVNVFGYSTETIGTNSWFGQLYVSNIVAQTPSVSGTNFWLYSLPLGSGSQDVIAAIGDGAGNVDHATNTITVKAASAASYGHNVAGCVTNITYTGANYTSTTDIAWNQQYQITSISTNGTVAESFEYDAMGRRVKILSGGVTNWMVYDGAHVIAEVNSSGVLQKSYTYGSGIDNLLAWTDYTTTNIYYPITDHLGSVHAVADESGSIVESYRFDAWGRVLGVYDSSGMPLSESAIGNRYLWQGREYSWKTGLYYFRARWYDPVTGRFLSKDPLGISGGLNQYVFCGNNPVNFVDPLGLDAYIFLQGYGGTTFDPEIGHVSVGVELSDGRIFVRDSAKPSSNSPFGEVRAGQYYDNIECAKKGEGEYGMITLPNKKRWFRRLTSDEAILKELKKDDIGYSFGLYCSTYAQTVAQRGGYSLGHGVTPKSLFRGAQSYDNRRAGVKVEFFDLGK